MSSKIKFWMDFIPVLLFFITYKWYGIIPATGVLVVVSIISLGVTYYIQRSLPASAWVPVAILIIFGLITLYTGDSKFIKMKPTVIYSVFGLVLLGGAVIKKPFIRYIFNSGGLRLSEESWLKFSARFGVFFLSLAVLNEIVWRNFSEELWVKFKVFGILILLIVFVLSQVSFFNKNKIPD
jgi:intracellular septation protein